jgi:hypothetical protein
MTDTPAFTAERIKAIRLRSYADVSRLDRTDLAVHGEKDACDLDDALAEIESLQTRLASAEEGLALMNSEYGQYLDGSTERAAYERAIEEVRLWASLSSRGDEVRAANRIVEHLMFILIPQPTETTKS